MVVVFPRASGARDPGVRAIAATQALPSPVVRGDALVSAARLLPVAVATPAGDGVAVFGLQAQVAAGVVRSDAEVLDERVRACIAARQVFAHRVTTSPIHDVGDAVDDSCVAAVRVGRCDGARVVVRSPEVLSQALANHGCVELLAHEAGQPQMVMPAAIAMLDQTRVMVTQFAEGGFVAGNKADPRAVSAAPEMQRLVGALIDLLCLQDDRLPKNVMFRDDGQVCLIDHDSGFAPLWRHKSAFFEGQCAYASDQSTFACLPVDLQRLVRVIAHTPVAKLAARYGIEERDAAGLRERSRLVRDVGLTAAIERSRWWREPTERLMQLRAAEAPMHVREDLGYIKGPDGSVTATPGCGRGHMTFGPYVSLPPGYYCATFAIRGGQMPTGTPSVALDVCAGGIYELAASRVTAEALRPDAWRRVRLDFAHHDATQAVELRAFYDGDDVVSIGAIELWRLGDTPSVANPR